MFNLSLMCVYLQVLNLKNRKIGNSHIFTHLMAERVGSAASREAMAEAWSTQTVQMTVFFGGGGVKGVFCGIKGQLIMGFTLKIAFSL